MNGEKNRIQHQSQHPASISLTILSGIKYMIDITPNMRQVHQIRIHHMDHGVEQIYRRPVNER